MSADNVINVLVYKIKKTCKYTVTNILNSRC